MGEKRQRKTEPVSFYLKYISVSGTVKTDLIEDFLITEILSILWQNVNINMQFVKRDEQVKLYFVCVTLLEIPR